MRNIFKILNYIPTKSTAKKKELLYKELFLTPVGQEILKDLMKQSAMFGTNVDLNNLQFIEGRRSMVAYIMKILYSEDIEKLILNDLKEYDRK